MISYYTTVSSNDRSIDCDGHHFHNLLFCILNRNPARMLLSYDRSAVARSNPNGSDGSGFQLGVWWVIKLIIAELDGYARISVGISSGFAVPSNDRFEECDSLNEFRW